MSPERDNENPNANIIEDLENSSPANGEQNALAAKTEECKILNDKYLRLAAEFENYKRLTLRDQREQIKFGNEQLLKELLPVIDNMERAIKAARDNGGSSALVQGVDLTLKQLSGALTKFGVQAVEAIGQVFDPSTHQAVCHMPSDNVPPNHVLEEFQKGYRLHDRILRAAMVSVSSGPAHAGEQDSTTN
ncbi:MAG: nucleotide exchange factor GrpE [Nitrospirae bacterium]|nr:nucleotide exchange factor GrpE [Nitrospirota bacterium]